MHTSKRSLRKSAQVLLAPSLLGLALFAGAANAALVPPQGYYEPIEKPKPDAAAQCPAMPQPFTGSLQFRSKYEGSDKSRSTFNEDSDEAFKGATKPITDMERGISKIVMQYMRNGSPAQLDCALNWLTAWAQAGALESQDFNHTGKSERKWALGSMASNYLHLKFSSSHPLAGHEQQAAIIEAWFGKLADQVVSDWDNLPAERNNNHTYWAAWAVMSTSVVLNRQDLFNWAVKEYKYGASQVGPDGYLPNEVKRQQRALAYHNYAMAPLTMIAVFGQANGVNLKAENNNALQRVGENILKGLKSNDEIAGKAGVAQDMTDLKDKTKFSWLEPYCTMYSCNPDEISTKRSGQPYKAFRLGGDLTRVYDPQHEKGGGS